MAMQIFADEIIRIWNGCEIRALLLLSLSLQVILIVFGSYRRRIASNWIGTLVWSAYMSADWVATVALGNLATLRVGADSHSGHNIEKPNNLLQSFWATFLLLHLGGPDTITAYALEDNELWLRHLLGLVVETGVAFYVFLRSWGDTTLTFLSIPVFIAGIIKYGERTWVLRSSSTKHFRSSMISTPDAGPDYAQFAENRAGKRKMDKDSSALMVLPRKDFNSVNYLEQAEYLFERFKYMFADLILGYYERKDCQEIIFNKNSEEAFKLVEVELAFLYDLLYTKAKLLYSGWGIFLRFITFLSSVSTLVSFSIFITDKHVYILADLAITYILLVGAIALEFYALISMIDSDWTRLWLVKFMQRDGPSKRAKSVKRWSGIITQHNLFNVCLKETTTPWIKIQKQLGVHELLEKYQNVTWQDVDTAKLKEPIFQQLKERSKSIQGDDFDVNLCKTLLNHRGQNVLKEIKCDGQLAWSTVEVEFDHSLLLWHIATELCYYDDNSRENLEKCSTVSRCISDYMLYLLVMCPTMLPKGIGEIRYRDTCAEATRFFEQKRDTIDNSLLGACSELFRVDTSFSVEEVKGDRSKSVLFQGCRLAKQLQSLRPVDQADWGLVEKWGMINKVWVELLAYAAVHCGWKEHAQQLGRGGELLTHVCLLMAHLGLSDQYQIQKQFIHQPNRRLFEDLLIKVYKKPRSECFLCLLQCCLHTPDCCA